MNSGVSRPIDWKKYAAVTIFVSAALFAFWIFLKYGIGVLMPFLLAWVLSLVITPLAEGLSRKTKIPRKLCAVVLLLLTLALLVSVVILALNRLFREIESLLRFLTEDSELLGNMIQQIVDYFSETVNNIPIFSMLQRVEGLELIVGDLGTLVTDFMRESVTGVTSKIPTFIGKIISGTPSALLFLLVFLISSVYFCVDGDRIYGGIRRLLPPFLQKRTVGLGKRITALLYRYMRVYLLIFLITFTELLIGFLILGRAYAFLLALVISAMDVLPFLGVGSVLLPWAAILFFMRDFHGAIGLLILWGVITVVRQIVEPRLIGGSFGMHPLVALVALYAGLKLFGFVGILLGPALAVLVKLVVSEVRGERADSTDALEGKWKRRPP